MGGRFDQVGPYGQRQDDLATDTMVGGAGYDTLALPLGVGVGDVGEGGDDDDYFEFAIDPDTPPDRQPLAVGTAVFASSRADYDIRAEYGRVHVMDLVGNGGRDDVGSAQLTPGRGPQLVVFLQFADQTVDVLNDVPSLTYNQGPVVASLALTIAAGTGIGTSVGVHDAEGNQVQLVGWTNGRTHGQLTGTSYDQDTQRPSFSYSPDAGFLGQDQFTFILADEFGAEGTGTVTVTVVPVTVVADMLTVGVGRAVLVDLGANDADTSGDPANGYTLVDAVPANAADLVLGQATGRLALRQAVPMAESMVFSYQASFADGTTNIAPVFIDFVELDETLTPDFDGTDSFQYQAATGQPASGPATVTINGQNDAPRDIVISASHTPENVVSGTHTGTGVVVGQVSAHDPETPAGRLAFSLADDAGGLFVLDGRTLKTAGDLDCETARYHDIVVRARDPQGAATDQAIRIYIDNANEGPTDVFLAGTQAIHENLPPGTLIGTLPANDPEGNPITYTRLSGPVNIVGDHACTAISFDHEFQARFTFAARAAEPSGDGVGRQFTIFADNVNEAPTAVDDQAGTYANTAVTFDVTANDLDPENDALSVTALDAAANATVSAAGGGAITYTPGFNFVGLDSFTCTVSDGVHSSTATACVLVKRGDIASADDFPPTIVEDSGPNFLDLVSNDRVVDANGAPLPTQPPIFVNDVTQPAHGRTGTLFGTMYSEPDPDYYGPDAFCCRVTDGAATGAPTGVSRFVLNVNDDPFQTYVPEYRAVEDRTLDVTFGSFPFLLDADIAGRADVLRNYVGTIPSDQGGSVALRADGTCDYTPRRDFVGYDSSEIVCNDYYAPTTTANGGPHHALIRINVESELPVANFDFYTIRVGETVVGNVLASDRSPPGNTPLSADWHGGAVDVGSDGTFFFTGTHAGTYIGFYDAVDSAGLVSPGETLVKVIVLPRDPPPTPSGGFGGPTSGWGWGDPHFVTYDRLSYDFQGQGAFVMTRATTGEAFEVQIRTTPWYRGAQVTIVEAMAARIGSHTIMLHGDGTPHVDGAATTLAAGTDPLMLENSTIGPYHRPDGAYAFANETTGEQVKPDGAGSSRGYLNIIADPATAHQGGMQGILGDGDGNGADDLQLADGTVLAQPINFFDLHGAFADAWRVSVRPA